MIDTIQQLPLLAPVTAMLLLALSAGALLGFASGRFKRSSDPVVDKINDLLPQTQCARCGYPGCRPYAQAIANGDAINKCPPGGDATIRKLANLLDQEALSLDQAYGETEIPRIAFIRESDCIGCAKCLPACPVDAIVGSPQQMHTVISAECTGCELCLAPCPVDCIDILPMDLPGPDRIPLHAVSEQPCIRCGLCELACPVELLPQQLYWFTKGGELDKAVDHNLMDCIECGLCNNVCPSHIPLVEYYRSGKADIHSQQASRMQAEHARQRYDHHQHRFQQQHAEEERRRRERDALAKARRKPDSAMKADPVHAALERVKARQAAKQERGVHQDGG